MTGIVIIVKSSLALAFSLAGIVAAVRFRTTLEDTKDAVYVFLAIGVGLAAGSQRLGTALIASIVFNVVNLALWKMQFGNIYVDQLRRTSALGLGDVLAGAGVGEDRALDRRPGAPHGDAAIGSRGDGWPGGSPRGVSGRGDRRSHGEKALRGPTRLYESRRRGAEGGRGPAPRDGLRWRLAEIIPGQDGVSILQYLVRLKPGVQPGLMLDTIRKVGGDHVQVAELRSLRSRTKRRKSV